MSLESEIHEFISDVTVRATNGEAHPREIAMARELKSRLDDYYDEIRQAIDEGRVTFDASVTVQVDGKRIKFKNIDGVAEWITNL